MKVHKIVLFLLVTKFLNCSSKLLPRQATNYTSRLLTARAAFFANSVFKDFITSVTWWHDKADEVTQFIRMFQGCVVVAPVEDSVYNDDIIRKFNMEKSFTQTVFFGADVKEVEYFVSLLFQDTIIPIRLIVVLTQPATYIGLKELMEVAWINDVADILILSYIDGNITLTTYFPYSNGKCGDFTPVHLHEYAKELFPKKFTNFHGCEIRTTLLQMSPYSRLIFENNSLVSMSGIDGNILHILFEILNAKMKVICAQDHGGIGTIVNDTATGSFADLVNKKADILLPALMMNRAIFPYVQFAHPHETADIIWFGPRRRERSEWQRVLQPFMTHITPLFFSTSIVFVVVIMTIQRFGLHKYFSRSSVFFQTFLIFLGVQVKFISKSLLANCLFVLWIWFCMVVRIAYQGDLVDGLQKTTLEPPLGTFDSAVKLVDGFGGLENVKDFYEGTRYYNKFQVIPFKSITEDLKALEAGKKNLIATDRLVGLDSAPKIQVLRDDPVTSGPMCFCMRPGWPAVADIDDVLLQMIETGIVEKVIRDHSWEWERAMRSKEKRGAKQLSLETLVGCFYGLGVMYGVCTLVLFIEIIYHRMRFDLRRPFFVKQYPFYN